MQRLNHGRAPLGLVTLALLGLGLATGCSEQKGAHGGDAQAAGPKDSTNAEYGDGITLSHSRTTRLDRLFEKGPDNYVGKELLVAGTIDEVCAKKGCWMTMRNGDETVRITFKDYSFFVPRNAAGHKALVQGVLERQETSEEMRKHYLEDAGATPEEIAAVHGPEIAYGIVATGVMIDQAASLEPPHQE